LERRGLSKFLWKGGKKEWPEDLHIWKMKGGPYRGGGGGVSYLKEGKKEGMSKKVPLLSRRKRGKREGEEKKIRRNGSSFSREKRRRREGFLYARRNFRENSLFLSTKKTSPI